jgi:hypothetical protein
MSDALDQPLQFATLVSMLKLEGDASADLLEFLAARLEGAFPTATEVKRDGGLFTRKKSVREIAVDLDDDIFRIARTSRGTFEAKIQKKVRGVVLKTSDVPVSQWTEALAQALVTMAERSADTRDALQKMITG